MEERFHDRLSPTNIELMDYLAQMGSSLGTVVFRSDGGHLTGLYFAGQKDCPGLPGLGADPTQRHDPGAGMMGGRPLKSIRVMPAQRCLDLCSEGLKTGVQGRGTGPQVSPNAETGSLITIDPRLVCLQENTPSAVLDLFHDAVLQLSQYFLGGRQRFELPIRLEGTAFQLDVWNALLAIPYGEYISYRDVAISAGRSVQHVRAVGSAVGRNPVSIIVPCHRVLSSTGALHGYTGGLDRKYALLQHEGLLSHHPW